MKSKRDIMGKRLRAPLKNNCSGRAMRLVHVWPIFVLFLLKLSSVPIPSRAPSITDGSAPFLEVLA